MANVDQKSATSYGLQLGTQQDLSMNLQSMARFRNLLVHMYWKIDYEKVYEILKKYL